MGRCTGGIVRLRLITPRLNVFSAIFTAVINLRFLRFSFASIRALPLIGFGPNYFGRQKLRNFETHVTKSLDTLIRGFVQNLFAARYVDALHVVSLETARNYGRSYLRIYLLEHFNVEIMISIKPYT